MNGGRVVSMWPHMCGGGRCRCMRRSQRCGGRTLTVPPSGRVFGLVRNQAHAPAVPPVRNPYREHQPGVQGVSQIIARVRPLLSGSSGTPTEFTGLGPFHGCLRAGATIPEFFIYIDDEWWDVWVPDYPSRVGRPVDCQLGGYRVFAAAPFSGGDVG